MSHLIVELTDIKERKNDILLLQASYKAAMKRRFFRMIIASFFAIICMTCISFADPLSETDVHFDSPKTRAYYSKNWDKKDEDNKRRVYVQGSSTIKSIKSTNESVAAVYDLDESGVGYSYFDLYRIGAGKCDIVVECNNGEKLTCHVSADKTPFKLSKSSYTFDKRHTPSLGLELYNVYEGNDASVIKITPSNKRIIKLVYIGYSEVGDDLRDRINIVPLKAGTCTLSFKSRDGRIRKTKIKIKNNYFKAYMKKCAKKWNKGAVYYFKGDDHVIVNIHGTPKAKATLKIGNKTYRKKITNDGMAFFTIKKKYKKGTKYTVTVSVNGTKYTCKGKVKWYK